MRMGIDSSGKTEGTNRGTEPIPFPIPPSGSEKRNDIEPALAYAGHSCRSKCHPVTSTDGWTDNRQHAWGLWQAWDCGSGRIYRGSPKGRLWDSIETNHRQVPPTASSRQAGARSWFVLARKRFVRFRSSPPLDRTRPAVQHVPLPLQTHVNIFQTSWHDS